MNNEKYITPSILKEWKISPDYIKTGYYENYKTGLLTDREYELLSYCGTELTYKEIADKMNIKLPTVNNFRTAVSEKLDIHTRPGLTAYAISHGLTQIYHLESSKNDD
jgi:DNA-binding CsgD family transcriptional regulator